MTLFFGYDHDVHDGDITDHKNGYYFNNYENISVPINGHHIHHETYTYIDGKLLKHNNNLTISCYQYPLDTIIKNNNIKIRRDTTNNLIQSGEKFIYAFAPKYFMRLHTNCIPGAYRTINGKPLLQFNYLKAILTPGVINAVNTGKCMLVICDYTECSWYTESMLDIFMLLCIEANIDYKNIIILTSNVHNAKNLYVQKSGIQVYFWQYWETAVKHAMSKSTIALRNNYNSSKYRFLLLNSRPRRHRHYICYKLWQYDKNFNTRYCVSLEKASITELQKNYDYAARDGYANSFTFFNTISEDEKKCFNNFYTLLPLFTPYEKLSNKDSLKKLKSDQYLSHFNSPTPFFKINHWNNINEKMILETDIHIITESLIEIKNTSSVKHLFFSEKTFKPIAMKAPFIIAAQPGALMYLRNCGYKTFSDYWDESYDNIEDPCERMNQIVKTILYISSLSNKKYYMLIKQAYKIAEYNYKIFLNRVPETQIINIITNFNKTSITTIK